MALLEVNWKPTSRELRQFALIWFPLACLMIGLMIWRATGSFAWGAVPVGVALILAPIAFWNLAFARRLFVGWMIAVYPLGWTISHLLMATIYFLLITPMGLLMRLFSRDSMGTKFDETRESYWTEHQSPKNKQQYFRQY